MKTCITCNKEKSDTDFKEKSQKCFDCYKEYQLNYRIKNRNKMKIYNQN